MSKPEKSVELNELMENMNFNLTRGTDSVSLKHPAITKVQSLSKLKLNDGIQKQLKQNVFTEPVRAQTPPGTGRRVAVSRKKGVMGRAKSQVCVVHRQKELEKSADDTWIEYLSTPDSSNSPRLKKPKT